MNDYIAMMLDKEIERTLSELSTVETGSEEAKATMAKLVRLHEQRIKEQETLLKRKQLDDSSIVKSDEFKIRNAELDLKVKQLEEESKLKQAELDIKDKQLAEESKLRQAELEQKEAELQEVKKGRRWRTFLDFLGIGVPVAATGWWLYKGMKFEEEGKIYSSRTSQWVGTFARLFRKG